MADWARQKTKTIMDNLDDAMARNSIENSNFYFSFMRTPREETLEGLSSCEEKFVEASGVDHRCDIRKFRKVKQAFKNTKKEGFGIDIIATDTFSIQTEFRKKETMFFCSRTLLYFLIKKINVVIALKYKFWICIALSILRGAAIAVQWRSYFIEFSLKNMLLLGLALFTLANLLTFYFVLSMYFL